MSGAGVIVELAMWLSIGTLLAFWVVARLGWWIPRWIAAAALLMAGFFLGGHSPVQLFGVQPWHGWLTPLVRWADGLASWGVPGVIPRVQGALILVLAGLAFMVAAGLQAKSTRR